MNDALIEAVAKAMFARDMPSSDWDDKYDEDVREPYRKNARAALAAIEAQGYRVVPVEPTNAMVDAMYALDKVDDRWPACADDIWRAMLSAAPKLTEGGE